MSISVSKISINKHTSYGEQNFCFFVHIAKNCKWITAKNSSAHFKTNKIKNNLKIFLQILYLTLYYALLQQNWNPFCYWSVATFYLNSAPSCNQIWNHLFTDFLPPEKNDWIMLWNILQNMSGMVGYWRKSLETRLLKDHSEMNSFFSYSGSWFTNGSVIPMNWRQFGFKLMPIWRMLRYEWRLSVNSASINGRSVLWEWVWNTFGLFYHQTYFYTILPIISMSSKPCCQKFCETISSNKGLSEKFCFNWAT